MAQREKVPAAKSDNLSSSPGTHIVGVNQNLQAVFLLTYTHKSNFKKANLQKTRDQIVSPLSFIRHLRSWEQFFKTLLKAEREAWDSARTLQGVQMGKNVKYLCLHIAQWRTNRTSLQLGHHMPQYSGSRGWKLLWVPGQRVYTVRFCFNNQPTNQPTNKPTIQSTRHK